MCPNCKIHLNAAPSKEAAVDFFDKKIIWCWRNRFDYFDCYLETLQTPSSSGHFILDFTSKTRPSMSLFASPFLIFTFGLIIETRGVTRSSASIRVTCECVKYFLSLEAMKCFESCQGRTWCMKVALKSTKKHQAEQEKQFVRGRWKAFLRP